MRGKDRGRERKKIDRAWICDDECIKKNWINSGRVGGREGGRIESIVSTGTHVSTSRIMSVSPTLAFSMASREELSLAFELACNIWADSCSFNYRIDRWGEKNEVI